MDTEELKRSSTAASEAVSLNSVCAVAAAVYANPAAIAITTIEKTLRHDLITSLLRNVGRDAISVVLF